MTGIVAPTVPIPASHLDLVTRPLCGVLTTMSGDGQPQSSLVWVDHDGECARINTTLERQKGRNLLVNPKVGIIFMVPGSNETYRVTGSATISTDPELLKRFEVRGKPPRVVIVVAVDEAFNHCPKAFVRAKLWDATARPSSAPSHGDFAAARDGKDADYARDYNEKYAERLKTELY